MSEVTRILNAVDRGDASAADRLLPLVYTELRKLAKQRLDDDAAGRTLQATALVHEAYLRLVDTEHQQQWNSRGHFFGAAAEAMRRILVEDARRKQSQKRGGDLNRVSIDNVEPEAAMAPVDLLVLNEALQRLEAKWPQQARLVKLRYFTGMTVPEAAEALGVSLATAERYWKFARTWLFSQVNPGD